RGEWPPTSPTRSPRSGSPWSDGLLGGVAVVPPSYPPRQCIPRAGAETKEAPMRRPHPLPRPIAVLVLLGLLLVLPVGLYLAVRLGAQPGADFLAHQFGGTAAVLLPRALVNWLAVVGALAGGAANLNMMFDTSGDARPARF